MTREHVRCGGELVLHHNEKNYKHQKEFYQCKKCGHILNVISYPSYEELVMSHQLWVTQDEYHRIKEKWALLRRLGAEKNE
jgi:hypothetical protein